MRYGYFDDVSREYVIERPDTPMSWVNYLGTAEYCALSQTTQAATVSNHQIGQDAEVQIQQHTYGPSGRYVYIRDDEDGITVCIWQPVGKSLDSGSTICRHGLGYTKFESEYKG